MISETNKGCIVAVKVIPKSSRSAIVGWEGELLKVRVAAVPEKGKANDALLRFLSDALEIPMSRISLHSGETGRHKRVLITGISAQELQQRIDSTY